VHFGGSYYALTQNYGSWQDAQDEAVALGANLVAIGSPKENAFLTTFIAQERCRGCTPNMCNIAWIGYRDTGGGNWGWINGEPVTYTNWYPGEPNLSAEDYVHMVRSSWDDSQARWNNLFDVPSYEWYVTFGPINGVVEVSGAIPEPSTLIIWSLLGALGTGLGWWRRRKRAV